ncbi:MauE/DoxX family redox-associated membrane protein [Virgisporangium aurantiacum]|uniref:MauE/DoxX family redox-associated membrane protein n=1 Tax=Virgisporangium aurantiacum TaxID=175570 RepID=UPI0019502950|nr:MauE/DoxX family redox-associated membrane protein [Virgisporangium aurantiacum]
MSDPVLIALNSLAAGGLMVAGATKLVAPQPVRRALRELVTGHEIPVAAVKAFAVAEIVVAFAVLLPSTRVVAGYGLAALGLTFTIAGAAGRLRRSTVACGCLGGGDRALGLRNVLAGVAFLCVAGLNVATGSSDPDGWTAAPLAGAAATLLLCALTHRALMWRLLGPSPSR